MKKKKDSQHLLVVSLSILVMLSCSLPGRSSGTPTATVNVMTAAARTVEAMTGGTKDPQVETLLAQGTASPSSTITVPGTSTNPATNTPQPTSTPLPCDRATFVTDVTVPDGTEFNPGDDFTKTWRIKNNGSCTWNTSYAIVFSSGEKMQAPDSIPLSRYVGPGETIDISVPMEAPDPPGEHRGDWKLRNASGQVFGIKADASGSFFVIINVLAPAGTQLVYNFAQKYCDAEWQSAAGDLDCPGGMGDSEGFVVRNDNPKLSDGISYSGVALETHPQWIDDGMIGGRYPLIEVNDGYHIKTKIGCLYGGTACNFKYQITYRIEGGALQLLTQGTLAYGDGPRDLDVDISSLNGKKVNFSLVGIANGSSEQDWIIWLYPRIMK